MRTIPCSLVAVLFLIGLAAIPPVAGFSVTAASVNPPGEVEDRTPLTVVFEIPRTGVLLYDQLEITTDLNDPAWDAVVLVQDEENHLSPAFARGGTLTINGAAFSYPPAVPARLRVTLNGTVPLNHTTSQTLLRIRQLDPDGTEYAYPSGYTLPMPGTPTEPVSPAGTAVTMPYPTEGTPAGDITLQESWTRPPGSPLPVTTPVTPAPVATVPHARPPTTPASPWPADLPVAIGTMGIAAWLARRYRGG
jgi:hypothetical protein